MKTEIGFDQMYERQRQPSVKTEVGFDQMYEIWPHALKEHLKLLAKIMACTGNLIGFNSGGYKALSYSLNIQVLFTKTTLFTLRRCFERAVEKCYDDSLLSIVASCSWGKHVTIGTGSWFDILLEKTFIFS